ncbi:MAG: hypothetical protein KatS3mg087_1102 [Patescibacteria group bacterium]|nr:MAG: hypothetical protein KatS3mg087_1053 [Patescibacteria group bacterium]GIW60036.1 MAG: hypothetical protein KatS3mg087_1102 [Patescibacteria group bacterium]
MIIMGCDAMNMLFLPAAHDRKWLYLHKCVGLWPASPPQYTTPIGFACWHLPVSLDAITPQTSCQALLVCRALEQDEEANYVSHTETQPVQPLSSLIIRDTPYWWRVRSVHVMGLIINYTDRADAAQMAERYGLALNVAALDARVLVSYDIVTILGDPHMELRPDAAYVYTDARPTRLSYQQDADRIEELLRTLVACDALSTRTSGTLRQ